MRRLALIALLLFPASAAGQVAAPVDTEEAGGAHYGQVDGITASAFSVAPGQVSAGSAVTVSVKLSARERHVRARVVFGGTVLRFGRITTRSTVTRRFVVRAAPGTYEARLRVRGEGARRLVRTPERTGTFPVTVVAAAPVVASAKGVFPVQGSYSFGGEDALFGAGRKGHVHQGQDVIAAEGTPLVSPVSGTVFWRKVQKSGAGHYLVIRATTGVDYVLMHLVAGSETVDEGDPVKAGQQIGQVGHTGDASGPHLHFEIWPDGWYAAGSKPIDPLPQLKAWAQSR